MNFRRKQSRSHAWDMTPMIDVVFQLIIFFMYTAQFAQVTRTPIDLPDEQGQQEEGARPAEIVIDVQRDGAMFAERTELDLEQVVRMVRLEVESAGPENVSVLIRAHQDCSMVYVNRLSSRLAGMGVRAVSLGTADQRR
jgi:biopolymer transport protein ExbD